MTKSTKSFFILFLPNCVFLEFSLFCVTCPLVALNDSTSSRDYLTPITCLPSCSSFIQSQCKYTDQFSATLCQIVFVAKLPLHSSHVCHLHLITCLPASVLLKCCLILTAWLWPERVTLSDIPFRITFLILILNG